MWEVIQKRCHLRKMTIHHSPHLFNGRIKRGALNTLQNLLIFLTLFSSINKVWCSNPGVSTSQAGYKILSEEIVYERWRKVIQRKVQMPNGKIVDYDVRAIPVITITLFFLYKKLGSIYICRFLYFFIGNWSKRFWCCHYFCMGYKNKNRNYNKGI